MSNSLSALGVFPQEYLYALHGSQYTSFEQTCDTVAQLRGLVGVPGMQVFIRGIVTAGDGGAGPFWWSATSTLHDDGQNVIVPSSPFQQPGAWLRLVISGANGAVFNNIAALTSFPIAPPGVIFSGTVGATASVQGYTTAGDYGGGTFDLIATSRTADNVVAFSVSGQSGFKWIRRYDLGSLTFEMAGAVGDYSFVTDNASGGTSTFTDNTAAFNALFAAFNQTAYAAGVIGNGGIRVHLRPGRSYLIRGILTPCEFLEIIGSGYCRGHQQSFDASQWLNGGSALVLDVAAGATYFAPKGETRLENFAILRRNLPLAPTVSQCIAMYGTSGGSWNDGSRGINCDANNLENPRPTLNGAQTILRDMVVIGFGTALYQHTAAAHSYDCIFDSYNGVEVTNSGDTLYHHNVKCLPLMGLAVSSPPDQTCKYHAGIAFNYHDRCDTLECVGCEAEKWSIGFNLSNLGTSPNIVRPKIECTDNAVDVGILISNFISQLRISDPYIGNASTAISVQAVQWDFATKASWFNEGGANNPSQVDIVGGTLDCSSTNPGAVISVGGDYCHTRVSGSVVYPNGADFLHVAALVGGRAGPPYVAISDLNFEQPDTNHTITVDPTIAQYVFLDKFMLSYTGTWIIPPGNTTPGLGTRIPVGGDWYSPAAAFTTLTPTAGSLYAFPIRIGSTSKIVNLGINVTATTGGSVRFGIFADSSGKPGALLYDSGIVSIGATGGISPGVAPSVVPCVSPWVWIALVAGATTTPTVTAFTRAVAGTNQNTLLGATSLANAAAGTWLVGYTSGSYSDTTLATALPATFGSAMAGGATIPAVFVGF